MAARLLHLSALYLVVGACFGLYMGHTNNFTLRPVHAHLLLVGWLTLAMAATVYRAYPAAMATKLAKAHFWLHNLGLPVFMVGLGMLVTGHQAFLPVVGVGALAVLLGLVSLALNIWLHVRD